MNAHDTGILLNQFGDVINFLLLLFAGFVVGSILENRHFASLKKREAMMVGMEVTTQWDESIAGMPAVEKAFFVTGCCVISQDYFKMILAMLKAIFGGRLGSYATLVDRGRREATLRMKENAKKAGCDMILGMDLSATEIGNKKGTGIGCIEVIASGTGVIFKK
jgi:uncharacterized protein YbjQ (UPF0145 family)